MPVPRATTVVALGLSALLAGCASRPPAPDVVATSTLGDVRRADLDAYVLTQPENRRGPGAGQDLKTWRRSLLEEMLFFRALEAEGRKNGVLDRPEVKTWLKDQVDSLLVEEIKRRHIAEAVKVTDDDVRAFYDSHPKEVSHSGQIRLRNIFRRVPRDAPAAVRDAVRREMQDLRRQIREGANFEEMARLHSDSETAPQGGLIGRLNHGDLGRSVEAIVWKLKEGEVSDVVGTPVGFQIFKLENHIPPFKMDFAEALPRLRKRLVKEATERSLEEQVFDLVRSSGASFKPEAAADPDPGSLVFSHGQERLTRSDWEKILTGRSFPAQREAPPRDQLVAYVGDRLRLWEAHRLKLEAEPDIASRIEDLKRGAAIRTAREDREKVAVSEADLKAFYEANKPRFTTPKLHHLRLLTLPFPESGVDYGVFERLQKLAAEIRAGGRPFADAARELSSDVTASRGGDAGFVRLDALGEWAGPRAYAQMEKVGVGEVSEPILVERYDRSLLTYRREGYMLLVVEEVHEPQQRPFDEAREAVRREHAARNASTLHETVQRGVLASIRARIYDRSL